MIRITFLRLSFLAYLLLAAPALTQANDPVSEGRLDAFDPSGQSLGPCPLKHTDVAAEISGLIAQVRVTQEFHNPFDTKIEAVYVFPLSERAAVNDMTMQVGDRTIRGQIKEREEAREIYEAAKAAGHVASLLDQERPNIFTQHVANIEPGEAVTIVITYVEDLRWNDGTTTFSFPMVVGPRYIPGKPSTTPAELPSGAKPANHPILLPKALQGVRVFNGVNLEQGGTLHEGQAKTLLIGARPVQLPEVWTQAPWYSFEVAYQDGSKEAGQFFLGGLGTLGDRGFAYNPKDIEGMGTGTAPDTDQVPDASKITPPVTPKGTRAGHDISLSVNIHAGLPILELGSKLHEIQTDYATPDRSEARVSLASRSEIPNKDFVLEFSTVTSEIGDALLTHTDDRGRFFTLILQPPKRVPPEWIVPKEMIFVIDKSGSMQGFPIETAKEAMRMAIENLNPNDTFNLMTFSGGVSFCFPQTVPNTPGHRQSALNYLTSLAGSGGTEMMKAIEACLGGEPDPDRVRIVCFMTDGYVGNDMAIIDAVRKNAGETRVFSFGIGSSVNRYLLDGMAAAGRGEVDYVLSSAECEGAAQRFYERVSTPVLTDIEIEWGGLEVEEVLPERIPDLFSAKPVVIKGRYLTTGTGTITLKGQRGAELYSRTIDVTFPESETDEEVVATLWARAKVDHLMNQDLAGVQHGQPDMDIKEAVIDLGLAYRLVTQFTSFVAVEEMVITSGGQPRRIAVPVEMPQGVSYEGVFGGEDVAGVRFKRAAPASISGVGGKGGRGGSEAMGLTSVRALPSNGQGIKQADLAGAADSIPGVLESKLEQIDKDTSLTEAQKSAKRAELKLAKELRGLTSKLDAEGNFKGADISVVGFTMEVAVFISDSSPDSLKAITDLGGEILIQSRAARMIIVRIDVRKLEALANLSKVRRIDLPAFQNGAPVK